MDMKKIALLGLAGVVSASNEAYVCSLCLAGGGLVEEAAFQVHLQEGLKSKCDGDACNAAVDAFIYKLTNGIQPETVCNEAGLCTQGCTLFNQWPVKLPDAQPDWPTERRALAETADLSLLGPLFRDAVGEPHEMDSTIPLSAHIAFGLAALTSKAGDEPCGHNVTCKILAFADQHVPLQDNDGDHFASEMSKGLRGSHWRGYDCDDKRDDVYPGRKSTSYGADVDHNCNGIVGGNETGSYEEIFCSGTPQRGLVLLGDSATAHFHIPPQWITAQGWNLDQLLPDALDELDFPQCSWGTGHVTPEECPIQAKVEGVDGVLSLYTQLRNRNRCSGNDFQNVGVNGARMTSSMQLAESFSRSPEVDQPVTVWLSLIGNDVCNGHTGFDHMTTPDDFYSHAMDTLAKIDTKVPTGSHVIALALFEGELLYDTMFNEQHPVGSKYTDFYEMMNCLEENPCWGWLNENRTVRELTTQRSDQLNMVYRNISKTATFKNFEFIFYSPVWVTLFNDYKASGGDLRDLIEKADGFHPSQAGNALFAQQFFKYLEENHPEALGAENPYNVEIDAMFFSASTTTDNTVE